MTREIWIWQNVLSPHTAPLAAALADLGHKVKYIAQKEALAERTALGWKVPSVGAAELLICATADALRELAEGAPVGTDHVFQGLRGNGSLAEAYNALARRKVHFWLFMETLDDRGIKGIARRFYYRCALSRWKASLKGVLAVGANMKPWLIARGVPETSIVPFTYFLDEPRTTEFIPNRRSEIFRIMFVGKLEKRKGVDVLLHALAKCRSLDRPFELIIVGEGPEFEHLQALSDRLDVSGSVKWLGSRSIDEVPYLMKQADLFVLPSRHDGWGVVVTEALMAGTPVIATDRCGAAEAVWASGCGAVVQAENSMALFEAIATEIARGPVTDRVRSQLASWALAFSAKQGAEYFTAVLSNVSEDRPLPPPPWLATAFAERGNSAESRRVAGA